MKCSLKIFLLTVLFLIIWMLNVSAISMNLNDYYANNSNQENTVSSSNLIDTNTITTETETETELESNYEEELPRTTSSTASDDEFLTAENVLSIIIIVIGILLVFLSIAILIRVK